MLKRILLAVMVLGIIGLILIPLNPVNNTLLKLSYLGSIGMVWLGLVGFFWNQRLLRVLLLGLPLLALVLLALPSSQIQGQALREDYVRRMKAFEKTPYYWGGENAKGIDCSGLPRRALRDALLSYGIQHRNSGAVREYLKQWWFDASARALAAGYRGYMSALPTRGTIETMSYEALQSGDLAVTADGVHVLAYIGNNQWIQADPGMGAVATLDGRNGKNDWFLKPVSTHRWSYFLED